LYTHTIIPHPDTLLAGLLNIHLDGMCPGINAVLQQFLYHGSRPLNDLAGSDLVDEMGRKNLD